jgi:hypothetical protein
MKCCVAFLYLFVLVDGGRSAYGQVPGLTYRRYLLPVVADGPRPIPGAQGSSWETILTLTNEGETTLNVYPLRTFCSFECPGPPDELIPPHLSVHSLTYTTWETVNRASPSGVILYVEDRYADALHTSLRVHDLSRQQTAWGAMVPVVPERKFSGEVSLVALPGQDPRFRVNVRVYSLERTVPVDVRIRAFAMNQSITGRGIQPGFQDTFLAERVFTLAPPVEPQWEVTATKPVNVIPEYLSIGDFASLTGDSPAPLVRLEISSATPGKSIWAFASITNNETQELTVVIPAEH